MTVTAIRPAVCIAPKPGLTGYKQHRCRCPECTEANRQYQARRGRLIAYGQWRPTTDTEPVRRHVRALMDAGIGWQRVADLAGVSTGAVSRVLYGEQGKPCAQLRKETADALLAVQVTPETLAAAALTDATGSRRRTQALAALGWSLTDQATRLGRTVHSHKFVLTNRQVTRRTAAIVAALYDELSTTPPQPSRFVTRTKRWAHRKGWAPPMAWDDDTIDDPNAQPDLGDPDADLIDEVAVRRALNGERVPLTRTERDHAFRVGIAEGLTPYAIGQLLHLSGTTAKQIARRLTKAA